MLCNRVTWAGLAGHRLAYIGLAWVLAVTACTAQSPGEDTAAAETVEDSEPADLDPVDAVGQDIKLGNGTGDTTLSCPGGAYCVCKADTECDSGLCLDTPQGKICAGGCEGACPDGFSCAKINSKTGDIVNICVAKYGFACEPCSASKQCEAALGLSGPACVDYGGSNGAFCSVACTSDSDCPAGSSCGSGTSVEGTPVKQCLRKPETDGSIACPCDARAKELALAGPCKVKAELGTCTGFRQCTAAGLQACSAPKASEELCDGIDNDCDGATDEGLCNDDNPCTEDTCDGATKGCKYTDNTAVCDDKNACTSGDVCATGKCAGKTLDCNDKNACTSDACDAAKGCIHNSVAGSCDDGDTCTVEDACKDGTCGGGKAKDCDDANVCTADLCDKAAGCAHNAAPGTCDDGNPCTNGDACSSGKCAPGTNICSCVQDSDCKANEDGNFCNGTLYCDKTKAPYVCTVDPKTLVTCDTTKDTVCLFTLCESLTGKCGPKTALDGKLCNADDSVCTKDDACKAGLCTPGAAVSCNDDSVCTDDQCDPKSGCKNAANIAACDDGNKCTTGDTCGSAVCVSGKKVVCDDKNDCTVDICDVKTGLCKFDGAAFEASPCDFDGSVCTVGDSCIGGKCTGGKPKVCDDSNVCTDDPCDAKQGCLKINNSAKCDFDGNPCTENDVCKNSVCSVGTKKDCDDKNSCTVDTCDNASGVCKHIADPLEGANCEDGDLCTTKDLCKIGKCIAGPTVNCDDSDTCTLDGCNPLSGCTHQTLADSMPCNDGNLCTVKDICVAGNCGGIKLNCDDASQCTDDVCATTGCEHNAVPTTTLCGTPGQWCVVGVCKTKGCGDGFTDKLTNEQCDDGNALPCDGCEGCQGRGYLLFDGKSFATSDDKGGELLGSLALEQDLTIEAWVRPDTLTVGQTLIAKGVLPNPSALTSYALGLTKTTGSPYFAHLGPEGGELITGTTGLKVGIWAHLAVVVASEKVRFYVNGAPAGTGTLAKQRGDGLAGPVVLGRRYADTDFENFNGGLDAVRLTAAALYGGPFVPVRRPEATADTRALWQIDQPAAATASDSGPYNRVLKLTSSKLVVPDTCYGVLASTAVCGDGKLATSMEACDDGNALPCDGCDQCRITQSLAPVGATWLKTPAVTSWAGDAFCPNCEMTVEAWIRLDKNNPVQEAVGLSCGDFSLMVNQGKVALARVGEPLVFGPTVDLAKWYHVAAVVNWNKGGAFRLYVDGQPFLPATAAGAQTAFEVTHMQEVLFIGAGGGGGGCVAAGETVTGKNPWTGAIDDVRVSAGMRYTDAFTPPKRALPDGQTRGLWHFDESSGVSALSDDSGNGVTTTATKPLWAADQCLGQTGASVCGDGQKAKYELCDNGGSNGPPPKQCNGVCLAAQTVDCTGLAVTGASVVKGTQTMTYYPYWTVDGWVKLGALPTTGASLVVGVANSIPCPVMPVKQDWFIGVGPNGMDASQLGGVNQTSSTAKSVWKSGVWQHFALQYDGLGKGSLWVNGAKVRKFSAVSTSWSTTCPLLLGNSGGGGPGNQAASFGALRLSKKARYGQNFAPPWQLEVDADTTWRFQFDDSGSGLNQTMDSAAVYKITWTSGAAFEADGAKCK